MKKLLIAILLCPVFSVCNARADGDGWSQHVNVEAILNVIKTTETKQYMKGDKFTNYITEHWQPTFEDVVNACFVSVSDNPKERCKTFYAEVVTEHNRLIDEIDAGTNNQSTQTASGLKQFSGQEKELNTLLEMQARSFASRVIRYNGVKNTKVQKRDCDLGAKTCAYLFKDDKTNMGALVCCKCDSYTVKPNGEFSMQGMRCNDRVWRIENSQSFIENHGSVSECSL